MEIALVGRVGWEMQNIRNIRIRYQDSCRIFYSLLIAFVSALMYIYVYIHVYMLIYIYIYVYISLNKLTVEAKRYIAFKNSRRDIDMT